MRGYPERTRLFGPRPSFQENLATIEVLRRQLCCIPLSSKPPYCKTYPYLDRDLLQFLFALPREQILRPHQRRSLMRRALAGIVPPEVLHGRRKAFVIRGPLTAIASQIDALDHATREMLASQLGILDSSVLAATLREVRAGGSVSIPSVFRVFAMERWLRNLAHWNTLEDFGTRIRGSAALASRNRTPHEFKTSLS
ncbi:MAG: hypothetical protein JSS69_16505 [Acidobacteria bacterium]|nr:hypothetical protein [Acidobacteriota bacterium]